MTEIELTIQKLKSSPLFYLFISSRELFHSNFWYWLSTLNPHATTSLFSNNNVESENPFFKREHYQANGMNKAKVDLFITNTKSVDIVIENKVKDFPKIEQLARIRESFADIHSKFVLATLFHCDDIKFDGWEIVTYRKIAETINPDDYTENNYYLNLIHDYKQFTMNLVNLAELLKIEQVYDFAISQNKDLFTKLNEIKLWEGYQKLRASHLVTKYQESKKYQMFVGYRVNNQKATIDFVVGLKDGYKIGVQLEDNQFRKFIIGIRHTEFAASLRESNLFFDSSWVSPQRRLFLGYKPDFQYQYEKIEALSFESLFQKIDYEIQNIFNLKAEIESKIPSV